MWMVLKRTRNAWMINDESGGTLPIKGNVVNSMGRMKEEHVTNRGEGGGGVEAVTNKGVLNIF